jgi:formate dehydrogenase maturation protein FdhE
MVSRSDTTPVINQAGITESVGSIWQRRADRARHLASRCSDSHRILSFVAELNVLQEEVAQSASDWRSLLTCHHLISEFVTRRGPLPLQEIARDFDDFGCEQALLRYWGQADGRSPQSFFARALLQPVFASGKQSIVAGYLENRRVERVANRCPRCGDLPQVGCLRPQGDGKAQSLCCSLCFHEWPYPRGQCAACADHSESSLSYYGSAGDSAPFHQFQLQTCAACRAYLVVVDLSKESSAVPDIDELVALPLNLWVQEQGYWRIQPNLAGI